VARSHAVGGAALAVLAAAGPAHAQAAPPLSARLRPAVRVDAIVARYTSLHGGVSVGVPLGAYVRLETTVAGGPVMRGDGTEFSARTDAIARFLLDPFDQFRYSPYAGAGASLRFDEGRRGQLVAVLGVEGRRRGTFRPGFEVGLGGGVRIGFALRQLR